jgi:hypothetical protein
MSHSERWWLITAFLFALCPLATTASFNSCASNPCQNGSTCVDTAFGFQCSCVGGFYGTLCNKILFEADTCKVPQFHQREITVCGVYATGSYYLCDPGTVSFSSSTCDEVCVCANNTGKTPIPGNTIACDGIDVPCTFDDAQTFCGVGYSNCTKRCQFSATSPWIQGPCIILNSTCAYSHTTITTQPCSDIVKQSYCGPATVSCAQDYSGPNPTGTPNCACTHDGFTSSAYVCDAWTNYVSVAPSVCLSFCGNGWIQNGAFGCSVRVLHIPSQFAGNITSAVSFYVQKGIFSYDKTRLIWQESVDAVRAIANKTYVFDSLITTVRCDCDSAVLHNIFKGMDSVTFNVFLNGNGLFQIGTAFTLEAASTAFSGGLHGKQYIGGVSGKAIRPDTLWNTVEAAQNGRITGVQDFLHYVGFPSFIDDFYSVQNCLGPSLRASPYQRTDLSNLPLLDDYVNSDSLQDTSDPLRKHSFVPLVLSAYINNIPYTPPFGVDMSSVIGSSGDLYLYHGSETVPTDPVTGRYCGRWGKPITIQDFVGYSVAGGTVGDANLFAESRDRFVDISNAWFADYGSHTFPDKYNALVRSLDLFRAGRSYFLQPIDQTHPSLTFSQQFLSDKSKFEPSWIAQIFGNPLTSLCYCADPTNVTPTTGLFFTSKIPGNPVWFQSPTVCPNVARICCQIEYVNRDDENSDATFLAEKESNPCSLTCSPIPICRFIPIPDKDHENIFEESIYVSMPCRLIPSFTLQITLGCGVGTACIEQTTSSQLPPAPLFDTATKDALRYVHNCDYGADTQCQSSYLDRMDQVFCHWSTKVEYIVGIYGPTINCVCEPGVTKDANQRCTITQCTPMRIPYLTESQYQRCPNNGTLQSDGSCICPDGIGGKCCTYRNLCTDQHPQCDPTTTHARSCTASQFVNATYVCETTPYGKWTGECCSTFVWDATNTTSCLNGGTTVVGETVYDPTGTISVFMPHNVRCLCPDAYTGPQCEFSSCRSTANGTCNGQGTCRNGLCMTPIFGELLCLVNGMDTGFTGCVCDIDARSACLDGSSKYPCNNNHGDCVPQTSQALTYGCSCDAGYSGQYCAVNPCGMSNCNPGDQGGVCVLTPSPHCVCNTDRYCRSGTDACELYVGDECDIKVGSSSKCGALGQDLVNRLCNDHGSCVNDTGAWHCSCAGGWSGDLCTLQPCPTDCGHGICAHPNPLAAGVCQCYATWIDNPTTSAKCNVTTCIPNSHPTDPASLSATCVCDDPSKSYLSGCTLGTCVVSNGYSCGPTAPLFPNSCSTLTLCPSSTCNCCDNSTCGCHWAFVRNTDTGICDSRCAPDTSKTQQVLFTVQGIQQIWAGCTCHTGWSASDNCFLPTCLNGGTLVSGTCHCSPGWSGSRCSVNFCQNGGSFNSTSGQCNCLFPYSGTDCTSHLCKNGGTPTTSKCSCKFAYSGSDCSTNRCTPTGMPVSLHGSPSDDGLSCECNSIYYDGPLCTDVQCHTNNTLSFDGSCNCKDQFGPPLCNSRICGIYGTYFPNNRTCSCNLNPAVKPQPQTGVCSASRCGALGTLSADLLDCTCAARTTKRLAILPQYSIVCIPNCKFGVYNDTIQACSCFDQTIPPFCDNATSSLSASSSSTGLHNLSNSTNSSSSSTAGSIHQNTIHNPNNSTTIEVSLTSTVGIASLAAAAVVTSVSSISLASALTATTSATIISSSTAAAIAAAPIITHAAAATAASTLPSAFAPIPLI